VGAEGGGALLPDPLDLDTTMATATNIQRRGSSGQCYSPLPAKSGGGVPELDHHAAEDHAFEQPNESSPSSLSHSCSLNGRRRRCLPACCSPPPGTPFLQRVLFSLHGLLYCASITSLVLLLGGAWTIVWGWHTFPAPGNFYDLVVPPSGYTQRIHLYCLGARNASLPTIWVENGGGGHSSSDMYGLQDAFVRRGRRVCIYDPPGTGWSPLSLPVDGGSASSTMVTAQLIEMSGEPGPFLMLGTQDDGPERIYSYALSHPEMVRALVPMQYAEQELVVLAAYKGIDVSSSSPSSAQALATSVIAPRLSLCDVIRFLGVQWGLMPLFSPHSPTFVPQDKEAEQRFLNIQHEGQWDMQCKFLAAQIRSPMETLFQPSLWTSNRSLHANIPVVALSNVPDDLDGACTKSGMPVGSDACSSWQYALRRGKAFMQNMTTITDGSSFVNCDDGGLGAGSICGDWLGTGSTISFVVENVLSLLGNLTTTV
jgi:hypothetical protein